MVPAPSRGRIRIVTWNVHACIGRGMRFDPDRIAAFVSDLDADLIALQEVEARPHLSRGLDQFAYLHDRIGGFAAEARTIETTSGDFGHMVLSRWPLGRSRVHDISVRGREPRAALDTETLAPFGRIRFIAAHFGLARTERRAQTEALRRIMGQGNNGAMIVAGDFNEWRRRSATHLALSPMFHSLGIPATFPARRPVLALDRIWCRAPLLMRGLRVERGAREASDHLPLIADLDWVEGDGTTL